MGAKVHTVYSLQIYYQPCNFTIFIFFFPCIMYEKSFERLTAPVLNRQENPVLEYIFTFNIIIGTQIHQTSDTEEIIYTVKSALATPFVSGQCYSPDFHPIYY